VGVPVLGWAVVLAKTRVKIVVVMTMATPMGITTRPHFWLLLLHHHHLR